MNAIILNEESSRMPIGDILATATGPVVEIKNQDGSVIAELILHPSAEGSGDDSAVAWAESEIEDIRRRERADRSKDVTTAELLRLAEERLAEHVHVTFLDEGLSVVRAPLGEVDGPA